VTYHLDYLIELHYQRAKYLQLPVAERRAAARLLLGAGARRCSINQSIMLFRVVQVTKSLQDPLEVGNSLLGISDNVRE